MQQIWLRNVKHAYTLPYIIFKLVRLKMEVGYALTFHSHISAYFIILNSTKHILKATKRK